PTETSAPSRSSFRPELQGLRALAVGLVLLFHLWPNHVSGGFVGVDVVFVVSGFLITGHLYRELSTTGTIALSKFWARRVMRLLPLAFTVLVFSVIAMLFFVPQTVWGMNVRQILGSLFYVENWVLAADSVDYMAAENEPSLVQHYWSLSIEEQFYIVLPLLLLGTYLLTKFLRKNQQGTGLDTQKIFIWTLLGITVATFIFSVLYTNYNATQAYFVTPTRFWEFSIGGLLAMLPAATKIPHQLQNLLGWAGTIAIVTAALAYDGNTAFPGYTALLPVIGAALFLRYGSTQPVTGIYWWASLKPALRMGDWSYAIYLWHWPLIIVATYQIESFTWPHKIGVIALTFILSAASQRFIEDPMRHAKPFKIPKRAFTLMASNMAIIAALTFFIPQLLAPDTNQEVAIEECTGANALLNNCDNKGLEGQPEIPPTQVQREAEEPDYTECIVPDGYTDFDRTGCSLGASEESAEFTIAVLGDSHARAWLPLLEDIGKQNNWNIQGYAKSACSPVPLSRAKPDAAGADREAAEGCTEFVMETAKELAEDPDIDIIATASLANTESFYLEDETQASDAAIVESIGSMWESWNEAGKTVVAMGEVPHFSDVEAPTCIAENSSDIAAKCTGSYEEEYDSLRKLITTTAKNNSSDAHLYDPVPAL